MSDTINTYYRSLLDSHDQKVYDDLMNQSMHYSSHILTDKPHTDVEKIVDAVRNDIPLMFYVKYTHFYYGAQQWKFFIKMDYLYPKERAKQLLDECRQWGEYIIGNMPCNINEQQKILWLHDVIVQNVAYGDTNGFQAHNIIGVIKDKTAVCEGISRAYKFLCDLAGIPCICVSGTLGGENHMWNMVWIANGTSFLDVTNDLPQRSGDKKRFNFLRSSVEMYNYHWNRNIIPECQIRNKQDIAVHAKNFNELSEICRKNCNADSLSVYLDFGFKLSGDELSQMIKILFQTNTIPFSKNASYSPESQTIYIN